MAAVAEQVSQQVAAEAPATPAKFRVEIPDVAYYQRIVKCQQACPVRTPSGEYVQQIATGEDQEAYRTARRPNPLASICGRVCGAPCETACRRGSLDGPVAIRQLKRFVTERHGVESSPYDPSTIPEWVYPEGAHLQNARSERVAIVGSGPAGLACAHDLARAGYEVMIFEAHSVPGGMLALGVPEYRLPRRLVDLEIASILGLGVTIGCERRMGEDFTLADLRRWGFAAVFLACGAGRSRDLRIEGADMDGVLKGIEFLLNANQGYRVHLGRRVVVIGGGNVAVDVARTALRYGVDIDTYRTAIRLGEIKDGVGIEERSLAADVARMALRQGAKEVHLVCLESREEMPAHEWEVEEAIEEGIFLHPSRGPKRILGEKGKVAGLETLAVQSVFDSDGRFNPTFLPDSAEAIPTDTVILAIGQQPDLSLLRPDDGVAVTPRGTIEIDPETMATSARGVFAGGDLAFGPRLIIDAVGDGRRAAASIIRHLNGHQAPRLQGRMSVVPHDFLPVRCHSIARVRPRSIPLGRRTGIDEIEIGFEEEQAREQARRCLQCQVNTVFDSEKCLLCGGCVDVCPQSCLRLARLSELDGDPDLKALLCARYGLTPEQVDDAAVLDAAGTALLKDEERCIRCGLCAARCPAGAITLERFEVVEVENEPELAC